MAPVVAVSVSDNILGKDQKSYTGSIALSEGQSFVSIQVWETNKFNGTINCGKQELYIEGKVVNSNILKGVVRQENSRIGVVYLKLSDTKLKGFIDFLRKGKSVTSHVKLGRDYIVENSIWASINNQ